MYAYRRLGLAPGLALFCPQISLQIHLHLLFGILGLLSISNYCLDLFYSPIQLDVAATIGQIIIPTFNKPEEQEKKKNIIPRRGYSQATRKANKQTQRSRTQENTTGMQRG
ncbi:hypothetical protein TMatcc_004044 [Talaromyces marneffei ATCC 18224]